MPQWQWRSHRETAMQKHGRHWPMRSRAMRRALSHKNPPRSIEVLQAAAPYELGGSAPNSCLYPVYVRAEAYLSAQKGQLALAEFQKILDHRGLLWNCATGALAHLGLGRAFALQGDTAKAKAAYQDFLTLWKGADPDIPILIAAKSEYARLSTTATILDSSSWRTIPPRHP
jgi:hypothetical protein